jgi:hypothetical protein
LSSIKTNLHFRPSLRTECWASGLTSEIGDDYREAPFPALPHSSKRQQRPMNLQRRIQDLNRSACFVWYSANTVANGRASVMVYNIGANGLECWFAAFNRREGWKVQCNRQRV